MGCLSDSSSGSKRSTARAKLPTGKASGDTVLIRVLAFAVSLALYAWLAIWLRKPQPRQIVDVTVPARPVELLHEDDLRVVLRLPGHERFNYTAFVDGLFTAIQLDWLDGYRPPEPVTPDDDDDDDYNYEEVDVDGDDDVAEAEAAEDEDLEQALSTLRSKDEVAAAAAAQAAR